MKLLKNHFGFSLVGLLTAVGITAIVALGAAYILSSSQNVSSFGNLQSEIDRMHYLNLQLARNPSFIMKQPGFEKNGVLYKCLQHSPPAGTDCTKLRAPASYVSSSSQSSRGGLQKNISSVIAFQPNCKMPQYCDSVSITTLTSFKPDTSQVRMNFQDRKAVSIIPGYVLVPMTGFNFNCVLTQGLITKLNYGSSQAVCQPLTGTLSTTTEPLANFGPLTPPTVQPMTNLNCGANGFSSIGSFQDQAGCMVLTPTTTTMPSPTTMPSTTTTTLSGPPPTLPLTNWNCTDGFAAGPPCNTGINIVDDGGLSWNNPGSAVVSLTLNLPNGAPTSRCNCTSGAMTVISCSGTSRYVKCQGGANPLPACPWIAGPAAPPNCYPMPGGWNCISFQNLVGSFYPCP